MTAVLDSDHEIIDCPHCKGKVKVEVERKPSTVRIEKREDEPKNNTLAVTDLDAAVERVIAKREADKSRAEPKEKADKKPTIKGPPHIKKGKCKNCGKLHDNENFEGEAKGKCDSCGAYFSNKSKGSCPYCKDGEIDALDDDDRKALQLLADQEADDDEEENKDEREGQEGSHNH